MRPEYTVTLNDAERTVTISNPDGLRERAHRDMGRMQWFSARHGWRFENRNEYNQWTTAIAKYEPEEYRCVSRYFRKFDHGIDVRKETDA